jgi:hypothetical protein
MLTGMKQQAPPLSPAGGISPMVGVRLRSTDADRLLRAAAERGVSRSVLLREAVRSALDRLERGDGEPPLGAA